MAHGVSCCSCTAAQHLGALECSSGAYPRKGKSLHYQLQAAQEGVVQWRKHRLEVKLLFSSVLAICRGGLGRHLSLGSQEEEKFHQFEGILLCTTCLDVTYRTPNASTTNLLS